MAYAAAALEYTAVLQGKTLQGFGCRNFALLFSASLLLLLLLLLLLQVMSVVGILQDETDPMVSVMKVRDTL
jgi:hypothetical protein